ncbi:MAG: hypothetical protein ACRDDE_05820 [Paraclostridium sp.]|uniref:hypothetical protein n=1 Tax=Paraclostridium sp. TaxID=2023273 RepID=UPI003EE8056B
MGKLFVDMEKEYQVQYKRTGLNRTNINYFDKLEDAEEDYLEKFNSPKFSYIELLECKPIKAYRK